MIAPFHGKNSVGLAKEEGESKCPPPEKREPTVLNNRKGTECWGSSLSKVPMKFPAAGPKYESEGDSMESGTRSWRKTGKT